MYASPEAAQRPAPSDRRDVSVPMDQDDCGAVMALASLATASSAPSVHQTHNFHAYAERKSAEMASGGVGRWNFAADQRGLFPQSNRTATFGHSAMYQPNFMPGHYFPHIPEPSALPLPTLSKAVMDALVTASPSPGLIAPDGWRAATNTGPPELYLQNPAWNTSGISDEDGDDSPQQSDSAEALTVSAASSGNRRSKRVRRRTSLSTNMITPEAAIFASASNAAYPPHLAEFAAADDDFGVEDQEAGPIQWDHRGSKRRRGRRGHAASRSLPQPAAAKRSQTGTYACRFAGCPKVFVQATPRNDHEATNHLGILPYVCDVCHKAFPSKRNLNRHGTGVHHTRTGSLKFHIIATAELRADALAAEADTLAAEQHAKLLSSTTTTTTTAAAAAAADDGDDDDDDDDLLQGLQPFPYAAAGDRPPTAQPPAKSYPRTILQATH